MCLIFRIQHVDYCFFILTTASETDILEQLRMLPSNSKQL